MTNPKWRLKKRLAGPRPKEPRYVKEDDGKDPDYLAFLHTLPCAVSAYPIDDATPCRGTIEAHHHTGGRGRGQKSDDRRAFSLCAGHHSEFHQAHATWWRWTKGQRREWQDEMSDTHRALYEGRVARVS